MTLALLLLTGITVSLPTWQTALYLLVLGLGIGLVMQVLVLAAQNAVSYEQLGVATSVSSLFRQVGGSIGVSIFGAIFANRLATNLASEFPTGTTPPEAGNPKAIAQLPSAVHDAYLDAFAASLKPVFAAAAGVSVLAFALSLLLRERPLRTSARAEGITESFAMPREAESLPEMERILATLAQRENRWRAYARLAERAQLDLAPAEVWLLSRLGEGAVVDRDAPEVASVLAALGERGLVDDGRLSSAGARAHARIVEAGGQELSELLDGWNPQEHADLRRLIDRFSHEFGREMPAPAPAS